MLCRFALMPRLPILNPAESYTFSRYAELKFDTADILAEFGVSFENVSLKLSQRLPIDPRAISF